jgi:type II secretory pathway component PulF
MRDHRWQADFFARLAALEQAGIPPARAFASLAADAPAREQAALERASRWCERGVDVALSLSRAGLVDDLDTRVLAAAVESGRLQAAYRDLAERHQAADLRVRRIRSKLLLPGFILVLAAFIKPFPAFFAGELDSLGYLRAVFTPLFGIVALLGLLAVLIRRARSRPMGRVLLGLPVIGTLVTRRQRTRYLEALAMLFDSGVPLLSALATSASAVAPGPMQAAYRALQAQVEAGATLEQAFTACPYISLHTRLLVRSAEQSGTLSDTLNRVARTERESLESFENELATWLPRVAYILVAIWMAVGILAGGPLTTLPGDL